MNPYPLDAETKHLDRLWEIHNLDGDDHDCRPGWCPYYRAEEEE
jgi:hypothetical protein